MMSASTAYRLRTIARIYCDAVREGKPITATVAAELDVTAGAAKQLIRRARQAGLLPPTTQGRAKALTHRPVEAMISRGTESERRWQVCRDCLVQWPCEQWRNAD